MAKTAKAGRSKKTLAARRRRAVPAAVCGVVPETGPFTFPAGGGTFMIFVTYPTGPDACPYTAKPTARWMTAKPRISEFDVRLNPNPRRRARQGVVVVQGRGNRVKHRVTIRQSGR